MIMANMIMMINLMTMTKMAMAMTMMGMMMMMGYGTLGQVGFLILKKWNRQRLKLHRMLLCRHACLVEEMNKGVAECLRVFCRIPLSIWLETSARLASAYSLACFKVAHFQSTWATVRAYTDKLSAPLTRPAKVELTRIFWGRKRTGAGIQVVDTGHGTHIWHWQRWRRVSWQSSGATRGRRSVEEGVQEEEGEEGAVERHGHKVHTRK